MNFAKCHGAHGNRWLNRAWTAWKGKARTVIFVSIRGRNCGVLRGTFDPSAGSEIPSRTSAPPRMSVCVRIDAEAHSGAAIVLRELPLLLHILT